MPIFAVTAKRSATQQIAVHVVNRMLCLQLRESSIDTTTAFESSVNLWLTSNYLKRSEGDGVFFGMRPTLETQTRTRAKLRFFKSA